MKQFFFCILIYSLVTNSIFAGTHNLYKDLPYEPINSPIFNPERHILDVYTPRVKSTAKTDVVVFIHGGKWRTASKEMFNYIGINFSEKGKTAVLINYRLTPEVQYDDMAMDCAKAVKWIYDQIEYFGGDPSRIFVYGHSSGAHLAALISTNSRYFDSLGINNPIKGCVLIDGFGMNLYDYLRHPNSEESWMQETFTKDESKWKDASPAFFVSEKSPPFLMFLGEKTKNIIYHDMKSFEGLLEKKGIKADLIMMDHRKHMEMVGQLFDIRNEIYEKGIEFMNSN